MNRKRLRLAAELGINLGLPWLAYTLTEPRWGEFGGLLASAVPPLLWSLFELAHRRRLDLLSMIVLAGIVLSLGAMALGGNARVLLMRESLAGGLIGLAFLVSLIFERPLVFHLARATLAREEPDAHSIIEDWWQTPGAPEATWTITAVWGSGLTLEAGLRAWLAWTWPPARFLAVTPFIGYGLVALLLLWTLWYRRRLTRLWDARDAALAELDTATHRPD